MRKHLAEKHPDRAKENVRKWKRESRKRRTPAKKVQENDANKRYKKRIKEKRKKKKEEEKQKKEDMSWVSSLVKAQRRRQKASRQKARASERKVSSRTKFRQRPKPDSIAVKYPWTITAIRDDPEANKEYSCRNCGKGFNCETSCEEHEACQPWGVQIPGYPVTSSPCKQGQNKPEHRFRKGDRGTATLHSDSSIFLRTKNKRSTTL